MGYTHYWNIRRAIGPRIWGRIVKDTEALLIAIDTPLNYEFGDEDKLPIVSATEIGFNGVGAGGHETFTLTPGKAAFEFCKTARKPYDTLVCAVLIVAARHAGRSIIIESDGWRHEWQPALDLVQKVLGEGYAIPQSVKPSPVEA